MRLWARATMTAATMRLALFSVAAAAALAFSQSANSAARISIDFNGGAACLAGCTGSSGPIDFGASALSNSRLESAVRR